jgi:hypothetical protein
MVGIGVDFDIYAEFLANLDQFADGLSALGQEPEFGGEFDVHVSVCI